MTLLVFLAALCLPVALLAPLLGRVVEWASFRRPQPPDLPERAANQVARTFQPLDLGPDPMKWPSELPNRFTPVPELPWPSETWDDPHFGRRGKRPPPPPPPSAAVETAAARRPARVDAPAPVSAFPSDDAVRAAVASHGVVQAAQWVMDQTGWDAKRTALHLRRVLNAR